VVEKSTVGDCLASGDVDVEEAIGVSGSVTGDGEKFGISRSSKRRSSLFV
jgi:hypothetical protein